MSTNSKKFFEPAPNYAALNELEEKNYRKPTEEDTRRFLSFWQEVYNFWKQKNSPFELRYVEEKVNVRKELIELLGIKS